MESKDNFRERIEALEQQTEQLQQHTHAREAHTRMIERRLHWWRGLACGLAVLGLLGWGLPLGLAGDDAGDKDKDQKGLGQRVAVLEKLLKHFSREKNEIFITGANLHIVNGLGQTGCGPNENNPIPDCPNSLGNLIIGYNEPRQFGENIRTGSHNVVVGTQQNFSQFGGLVVGDFNTISGAWAAVSGGQGNHASGFAAAVSGGSDNQARGSGASVSGGERNEASGFAAAVSGGFDNEASGLTAAVSGGERNIASGSGAAVSGGIENIATGSLASVSAGHRNEASGSGASVSGGERNIASGREASVSGGGENKASGTLAAVSGGDNRTAPAQNNWAAGSLLEPN